MKPLLTIALCITLISAAAQQRVSVGFYNVENLFDTLKNPLTDDGDYTPEGLYGWNTAKYQTKTTNIARVLDDMALDVIGLAEVENKDVLRDLVTSMRTDYAFIHLTGGDRRGMDMALLYKGDKFFPDPDPRSARLVRAAYGREFLYVKGKLAGQRVDLIVCHMPSNLNTRAQRKAAMASLYGFVESLRKEDPEARPIVMGDFNASPTDRLMREEFKTGRRVMDGAAFLFNPFYEQARKGMGTYVYNDRWHLYDNIFLSSAFLGGSGLTYESSGIFIREYLLSQGSGLKRGYPLRTFSGNSYLGGFSDHLPVYVYLTL